MLNIKKLLNSEFYRNVFTLISATSAAQALAILIYPILSRIYTIEEHGIFGLYMSIISITSIIATGKYELSVLLPKSHEKSAHLISLSVLLALLFSCILFILVLFFGKEMASALGNEKISRWLYLVPLSTFLVAIFQSLSYWSNRQKRYRTMAAANMSQSLTNSVVKISSSGLFSNGGGLIIGALIGQVTGAAIYLSNFLRKDKNLLLKIRKEEIYNAASEYNLFPKYSMIHYLVNNFSGSLPIFALSSFFSTENAGLYSVAFTIVFRPINLITSSLGHVLSQRIIARFNENINIMTDVRRIIFKLIQIGTIPFILAAVAGPAIFSVTLGKNWTEAGRYMQIILPWLFITLISSPLSFLPDMLGKQKKAMWLDIFKFILRLLAIGIGIYYNNIYILLIGFSISSFLMTLYTFFWYIELAKKADNMKLETIITPEILINEAPDI